MKEIILSSIQIKKICEKIGKELNEKLEKETNIPVFVGVMKGGLNFMMDLIKEIKVPMMTDYIQISSWEGTSSTGIVNLKKDLTLNITNRTVILVEDVVDSGYSLHYLKDFLINKYHPKQIILACLIDKQAARKLDVEVNYTGMVLKEDKFLMGYGLDYKEIARNVNCVYVPDKSEIDGYEAMLAKKEN